VEGDESALAKLGGAMTDTALAILMAGIVASHLRMHRCKRDDVDNDCYDDDDDDNDGEGGGFAVDGPGGRHRGCRGPRPGVWVAVVAAARDDDDNDRNDEGEGGNPPIPNDAAAGGGQ